ANDAARAGAIVEEATYLVGVASTAAHVAKTARALAALERADLLFEVIGNPAAQARAALNRASTLSVLGANAEAATSAALAIELSRRVRDTRCEGLSNLVLSSLGSLDADEAQREHWQRARTLLGVASASDELRLAAVALSWRREVAAEAERLDEVAASSPDVEIALEWWAARARHVLQANAGASTAERVLTALSRLMSQPAPVDVVGQAYSAGAELAAHAGDGERNLQFIAIARDCH